MPGVTHWQSPGFFAYFPINSSVAGFLGEILSAGINMMGFSWITSPAATELEMIVLDWLANLLHLPDHFLSNGTIFNFFHVLTGVWAHLHATRLMPWGPQDNNQKKGNTR